MPLHSPDFCNVRPHRAMRLLCLIALAVLPTTHGAVAVGQQNASPATQPVVEKPPEAEIDVLKRAAEGGDVNAQFNLGLMYMIGTNGPKDAKEALKWLNRAADQGDPAAQFTLGGLYENPERGGIDVPRNPKHAAESYRQAAEQGFAMAQFALAGLCLRGDGVPKDNVRAYFWLNVFASDPVGTCRVEPTPQGRREWDKLAALARETRDSLAVQMTAEQIAEAQRLSREFRPTRWRPPAERGDAAGALDADAAGSGFFITQDGYFVSNYHVVANARRIHVRIASTTYSAVVVRHDASNDLALLKVLILANGDPEHVLNKLEPQARVVPTEPTVFNALHVRGSTGVRASDQVFTVGYPNPALQGITPKFSSGEVAALTGPGDDPRLFQISVPVQPGNSGGPLVDVTGSVVGVVVSQLDKIATLKVTGSLPENVNYAVKSTLLLALLESVPELRDKLQPPGEVRSDDRATVGQRVEKATGLVLVDR